MPEDRYPRLARVESCALAVGGAAGGILIALAAGGGPARFAIGYGIGGPPGQNPALVTSCEYASRATSSGKFGMPPGWGGAVRPEKRVTARSKLPQKKWTGLALPRKPARKRVITRLAWSNAPHNARTCLLSKAECRSSSSKGIASAISLGTR